MRAYGLTTSECYIFYKRKGNDNNNQSVSFVLYASTKHRLYCFCVGGHSVAVWRTDSIIIY